MLSQLRKTDETKLYPFLICFSIALLLFIHVLSGKFTIAGTDVLFNHFPNLIFGHRSLHEFGKFNLWNKFIFLGADFTRSMHAHYLNPLYWPFMLLPEKYLLHSITYMQLVMNALTGYIWFKIANTFNVRRYAALIVAVVAQASMFFWFAMTTLITVPMYLFASLVILLILTKDNRCLLSNYLYMSVASAAILITPHPAYILGCSLPIAITFICSVYKDRNKNHIVKFAIISILAVITAFLISGYRIIPTLQEVFTSCKSTGPNFAGIYANAAYFFLSIFNPLAVGINIGSSQKVASMLGYPNMHIQMHNVLYFGVVPLATIFLALKSKQNKAVFWLLISTILIILSNISVLEPLTNVLQIIFFPILRDSMSRVCSQFSFLFLLIFALRQLPNIEKEQIIQGSKEIVLFLLILLLFAVALNARLLSSAVYNNHTNISLSLFTYGTKIISILIILTFILVYRTTAKKIFAKLIYPIAIILTGGSLFLAKYMAVHTNMQDFITYKSILYNFICLLFLCATIILLTEIHKKITIKAFLNITLGTAATLFFLFMLYNKPGLVEYWSNWLGWGTLIVIVITTVLIFAKLSNKEKDAYEKLTIYLFILTLFDLLIAYNNYTHSNSYTDSPIYTKYSEIFPDKKTLDENLMLRTSQVDKKAKLNLLKDAGFKNLQAWSFGGENFTPCENYTNKTNDGILCLSNNSSKIDSNLFQDIQINDKHKSIVFGVWIKAEPNTIARLFITGNQNISSGIVSQAGDNVWHWVSAYINSNNELNSVRPHINLEPTSKIEIFAPVLTYGKTLKPNKFPPTEKFESPKSKLLKELNVKAYRFNHITTFNNFNTNELMSAFAEVFETPTYAGVDSLIPNDYNQFLTYFHAADQSWWHRAGLTSSLTNNKLLNLLGVKYDINNGLENSRKNALARISAFSNYESINDMELSLNRLNSPSFNETETIILNDDPHLKAQPNRRFIPMDYQEVSGDKIKVNITKELPRIILFNDHYSKDWQALWNNTPIKVFKANAISMAVVVPEGSGQLTFEFKPELFNKLVKISVFTSSILLILFVILYSKRRKDAKNNRS